MNKKVVIFGGGTGLSYIVQGLKDFPLDLTAVITVADSGRSTGKLREEFHIPAVGDIRRVLSSLSPLSPELKQMLEYRFQTTSDLNGHAFGNLMVVSLLNITGSLKKTIEELEKLLHINNTLLPLSEDPNITLMAETVTGTLVEGEAQITNSNEKIKRLYYKEDPVVLTEVIEAIEEADLILFSMGSLYTSVLPHILAKEVVSKIDMIKAPLMYVCNIVTQPGETDNFTVSDHVNLLNAYLNKRKIDVVIASSSPISKVMVEKYATKEQKDPVKIDYPALLKCDVELIEADLLDIVDNTLKHHSQKLSALIFSYLVR